MATAACARIIRARETTGALAADLLEVAGRLLLGVAEPPHEHGLVGGGLGALAHDDRRVVGKAHVVVQADHDADAARQLEAAGEVLAPERAALLAEREVAEGN